MFSAFKRLAGKAENVSQNGPPSHQSMPGTLQKKFSKGVQYNMKIIIKGDRNVGKSCLLERLQGKGFIEEYVPTDQIQVASIQWAFKATDDIVKVEVWDVVDRGKSRPQNSGLKLALATAPVDTFPPALDAEFLDVYKGTHGVILMMDVTKNWTFEYICKELEKIPSDLPVLILGNHCDMSHHQAVTNGQVTNFIENFERSGETLYAESSMRNGFGLHLLHRFLGLPFLRLQKLSLELLLERNKKDMDVTKEEIQLFQQSDESNYNKFLENLVKKRRQIAEHNAKIKHVSNNTIIDNATECKENLVKTSTITIGAGHPILVSGKPNIVNSDPIKFSQIPNITNNQVQIQSCKSSTANSVESITQTNKNDKNFIKKNADAKQEFVPNCKTEISKNQIDSVEDFCPEDSLDKSFLDDLTSTAAIDIKNESDSDAETGNPLVATFQEEIDYSEDICEKIEPEASKPVIAMTEICDVTNKLALNCLEEQNSSLNFESSSMQFNEYSKDKFESDSLKSEEFDGDFGSDEWAPGSKIRRSPEGGEDSAGSFAVNIGLMEAKEKETKKHKKAKKSKDKIDKDRKKHKKSDKKKRDELELFLNGPSNIAPGCEAYEAI